MMAWYKSLLRPLLFQMDAEQAHKATFLALKMGRFFPFFFSQSMPDASRQKTLNLNGLTLPNPVGLAAGMDKNAELLDMWPLLGFGFAEIGTVTPKPQLGNPRPRLFRLIEDEAIINRMGFNNDGAIAIARRLEKRKPGTMILGGNIGKNKNTANEEAYKDYVACFETLFSGVDYFTVNVSSPNTPGLRQLLEKDQLISILDPLQNANQRKPKPKPVFLKISPDLENDQIPVITEVCRHFRISGLVVNNTTISRSDLKTPSKRIDEIGSGGLSGGPLREKSQSLLEMVKAHSQGLALIASGGIMQAEDARRRLDAGAEAVQLYTGLVYEGPQLIGDILKTI